MNYKLLLLITISLFVQPLLAQSSLLSEEDLKEEKVYKNLEKALKNPSEVYILDLSGQGLDKIPRDVGRFRKLQVLILTNNNIGELPREMTRLRNLQILYLDSNNFNTINFDLSNPMYYGRLEKLYIGYNPLRELPVELSKVELEFISLSGNRSLNMNQVFTPLSAIETLEGVDISYLELDTVPWEVANVQALRYLDLSGNPSCAWDTSFKYLAQVATIESLILRDNKMRSLTEEVAGLNKLVELDLSDNNHLNIRQVLTAIKPLKKIEVLNFSNCGITELPSSIGNFTILKELNISHNNIKTLPNEIQNLEEVEVLDASYNELYDLPANISFMQSMEKLFLSHNPLEYLPNDIEDLHELEYIELPENSMDKTERKKVKKLLPDAEIVFIEDDDN